MQFPIETSIISILIVIKTLRLAGYDTPCITSIKHQLFCPVNMLLVVIVTLLTPLTDADPPLTGAVSTTNGCRSTSNRGAVFAGNGCSIHL